MNVESIQYNQDSDVDTFVVEDVLVRKEFGVDGVVSKEVVTFPDGKIHSREYYRTEKGIISKIVDYYSSIGTTESLHDDEGRIRSKIFNPIYGDSIEHRYDRYGRVTMEIRVSPNGALSTIKYTRDKEGNIVRLTSITKREIVKDIFTNAD